MTCRLCQAAFGTMPWGACGQHTQDAIDLAYAIATLFQAPFREVDDEVAGWYMDDAANILEVLGPQERWDLSFDMQPGNGMVGVLNVNGNVFVMPDNDAVYLKAVDLNN